MLNHPWIDPRDVDWTDALNGLRNPGLKFNNNPFGWQALNDKFTQALRNANGIEPRVYVCPDPVNNLIQPGATVDYEVPTEPNTWLWALTASVSDAADVSPGNDTFLVNITDAATGAQLFSQPVNYHDITGDPLDTGGTRHFLGSGNSYRGPLMLLSTPHLFTPPSYPIVRLVNTASSTPLRCRVTLFTAVEYDLS